MVILAERPDGFFFDRLKVIFVTLPVELEPVSVPLPDV